MFTLYLRRNLSETAVPYNLVLRGAVDDGTRTEVTTGKIFWRYEDEPDMAPQFWRDAVVGYEAAGPFDSKGRDIRLYFIGKTELDTPNAQNFAEAEQKVVSMSDTTDIECIFDHWTDATTTGTSEETLYTDRIDAGQLSVNGDKVVAEYTAQQNTLDDHYCGYFAGTRFFYSKDIGNVPNTSADAELRFVLMRDANDVVKIKTVLSITDAAGNTAGLPWVKYSEVSGIDLDATSYDLEFKAESGYAGSVTAKMAHGLFIPAASTNTTWLLDGNGEPIFDGNGDHILEG